MSGWHYLVVEVTNNGRTVLENGKISKAHTKKGDLTALPRTMWNAKGKKMIEEAGGEILNEYGSQNWELVSVQFSDVSIENKYFFKKSV
jgi:hypothetical protein